MAQSVLNDALWEKLLEKEQKINKSVLEQKQILETQTKDNHEYFNLRFIKFRKSSFFIAILGLLVFILTIFCMKQQNDYSLLVDGCNKQSVTIEKLHKEFEVYKEIQLNKQKKK